MDAHPMPYLYVIECVWLSPRHLVLMDRPIHIIKNQSIYIVKSRSCKYIRLTFAIFPYFSFYIYWYLDMHASAVIQAHITVYHYSKSTIIDPMVFTKWHTMESRATLSFDSDYCSPSISTCLYKYMYVKRSLCINQPSHSAPMTGCSLAPCILFSLLNFPREVNETVVAYQKYRLLLAFSNCSFFFCNLCSYHQYAHHTHTCL